MLGYTEHSEAYQIQTGEFARLNRSNLIWSVYPVDISFRVHLHDFLFDLVGSCLSLFNDFRLKIAVSVARHCDFALAIVADYRLFPITIPAVTGVIPGYGVLLVTEMFVHFSLEHLLYCPGKQLFQLCLNVSGGSDQQVGLAVCHQQLHQFHLSLV